VKDKKEFKEFNFSTHHAPFFSQRASKTQKVGFFAGAFVIGSFALYGFVAGAVYLPQINGYVGLIIIGLSVGIGLPLINYYGREGHDPREMVDAFKDIASKIQDAFQTGQAPSSKKKKEKVNVPRVSAPKQKQVTETKKISKPKMPEPQKTKIIKKEKNVPKGSVERYKSPIPLP